MQLLDLVYLVIGDGGNDLRFWVRIEPGVGCERFDSAGGKERGDLFVGRLERARDLDAAEAGVEVTRLEGLAPGMPIA